MTALDEANGIPATVNPFTIGHVLRREWRFDGPVVADFRAVEQLIADVDVENMGQRMGDGVVQLHIHDEEASVTRPVTELRGFERVKLRPGESRVHLFAIGPEDLGFFNREMRLVGEPGRFVVIAGTGSEGGLVTTFDVEERRPVAGIKAGGLRQ